MTPNSSLLIRSVAYLHFKIKQACLKAKFSKCSASHLQQLKPGLSTRGCAVLLLIIFGLLVCFFMSVAPKPPVLLANLIAARTAAKFGLHLCPSSAVLPPRKNDRLPIMSWSTFRMCSRCSSHRVHRKRKWSTVSSS
ncbi:hypothetical protein HZ326_28193 [Fusarium oxysporum f. sp. albedinis]|nr:hypothetical protein HZ326_28193 [Fusarium oxysporum f. sp. albedinis]